jgi:hypothetical protein
MGNMMMMMTMRRQRTMLLSNITAVKHQLLRHTAAASMPIKASKQPKSTQ